MMKTLAAVVMAAALAVSAQAQEALRQITVTGEARAEAAPDMAVMTLGVSDQAPEAAAAMAGVSRGMVAVVDRLLAAGLAPEDMQTREISLHPVWQERSSAPREVSGFAASSSLTIRLRDLDRLGPVLDQVLQAGANEFRGLRFDLSDPQDLQDSLRKQAVEDAFRKARQLAEAAGMRLGPPRRITDAAAPGSYPQPAMMMEMARSGAMPVEPGSLSFSHSVTAVFDMSEAPE